MTKHRKDRADLIVETIADFHATYGYGPTVRELGERVGLSSTAAVHHHLTKLHQEGRVTWEQGLTRTIAVVVPESEPEPTAVEVTAVALHRWRHPTFKGWGRCRCVEDALEALALIRVTA